MRSLEADMSSAKNRPMNPKCATASWGDRGHGHTEGFPDGLRDLPGRDRVLGDGVQAGPRRCLLEPEPDEPGRV